MCHSIADDEPDDGSQHYVLISGFHEPHLVIFLSELGIHVDCIVKVVSEEYPPPDLSSRSADDLEEPKDPKELCKTPVMSAFLPAVAIRTS